MLGAAVVDDILALILLSVAVGMAADGGVDAAKIALALAVAVAFVAFVALGGTRAAAAPPAAAARAALRRLAAAAGGDPLPRPRRLRRPDRPGGADRRLPGRDDRRRDQGPSAIEQEVAPLYAFFPPFFFAFIGIELDLGSLFSADALLLLAA